MSRTYRHKKRGTEYVLIGIGKMQAEHWEDHGPDGEGAMADMREVAIYRSVEDGSLWVRPREEFEDGRFEVLTSREPTPETINGQTYGDITEPHRAALYMIRDAIQELFGPIASLESEDAELLRGPEPHHTAEAYISALQRVKARMPEPAKDGPEVVDYLPCGSCQGSGYGGHPDSGVLCGECNGRGGLPLIRQSALTACQQEVERLREFERQHDYCCCGSRMEDHNIGSGHSPVSVYDYQYDRAVTRAETAEARNAELVKALDDLLDHVDRNTCLHEGVHRGGSIWTICDDCGEKWADDRGGFVPYSDPDPVARARTVCGRSEIQKETDHD